MSSITSHTFGCTPEDAIRSAFLEDARCASGYRMELNAEDAETMRSAAPEIFAAHAASLANGRYAVVLGLDELVALLDELLAAGWRELEAGGEDARAAGFRLSILETLDLEEI